MASTVHCDVAGSWRELMMFYVPQMSPFSPQEIIWNCTELAKTLMACGCNNILVLTPHNDVLAQC